MSSERVKNDQMQIFVSNVYISICKCMTFWIITNLFHQVNVLVVAELKKEEEGKQAGKGDKYFPFC